MLLSLAAAAGLVVSTSPPATAAAVAYGHGVFAYSQSPSSALCNESGAGIPVGVFFGCTVSGPVVDATVYYRVSSTAGCDGIYQAHLVINSTLGSGSYNAYGLLQVHGTEGTAGGTFTPFVPGPQAAGAPSQIVAQATAAIATTDCSKAAVQNPSALSGTYDLFLVA